ncbi:hypothetical protein DFJ74DRAFT_46041 [Hyaloraphidium curvatum]|nr:hypothetical protein DFJ74DRAFT_46041 [Hyaloraphidium curvatum]
MKILLPVLSATLQVLRRCRSLPRKHGETDEALAPRSRWHRQKDPSSEETPLAPAGGTATWDLSRRAAQAFGCLSRPRPRVRLSALRSLHFKVADDEPTPNEVQWSN